MESFKCYFEAVLASWCLAGLVGGAAELFEQFKWFSNGQSSVLPEPELLKGDLQLLEAAQQHRNTSRAVCLPHF